MAEAPFCSPVLGGSRTKKSLWATRFPAATLPGLLGPGLTKTVHRSGPRLMTNGLAPLMGPPLDGTTAMAMTETVSSEAASHKNGTLMKEVSVLACFLSEIVHAFYQSFFMLFMRVI